MFTGSSPKECMLSGGATNFGEGCPHTLLSNRYWRGAWRRVMVLREGRARQKPGDLFGICQHLPALKWTMRCSNWHQSHIRRVNNANTYHRHPNMGHRWFRKADAIHWMEISIWCRPLTSEHITISSRPEVNVDRAKQIRVTIFHKLVGHPAFLQEESQSYNYWHTCGNRCRRWRSPDRPCSSIPTTHHLRQTIWSMLWPMNSITITSFIGGRKGRAQQLADGIWSAVPI